MLECNSLKKRIPYLRLLSFEVIKVDEPAKVIILVWQDERLTCCVHHFLLLDECKVGRFAKYSRCFHSYEKRSSSCKKASLLPMEHEPCLMIKAQLYATSSTHFFDDPGSCFNGLRIIRNGAKTNKPRARQVLMSLCYWFAFQYDNTGCLSSATCIWSISTIWLQATWRIP